MKITFIPCFCNRFAVMPSLPQEGLFAFKIAFFTLNNRAIFKTSLAPVRKFSVTSSFLSLITLPLGLIVAFARGVGRPPNCSGQIGSKPLNGSLIFLFRILPSYRHLIPNRQAEMRINLGINLRRILQAKIQLGLPALPQFLNI